VLSELFGGRARHARRLAEAEEAFARACRDWDAVEGRRQAWVRAERAAHAATVAAHEAEQRRQAAELAEWERGRMARERESVERYLTEVAARVPLPPGLPRAAEIAYSPRGEQVLARVELPGTDVVPLVTRYAYVASKDEQRETARPRAQVRDLYRSIISQVVLLYLRDLFDADPALQTVDVNGHVHTTNPATGHREYPCLISVTVERPVLDGLNLREVTPQECLRHLNALVSPHPDEVEPVTPIREFDLSRFRFVDGLDAVSRLDARPDLMEMTPTEFEHFVRQVFEAMGMQGWTTERTGDDGIDAVVVNTDPIVGGLTVVQVKQYSRVLGVNHIRELVGAMDEKRAGRGILVTTSWFTSGCWTKAKDNGRIELIDGPRLCALTRDHLHKQVLIGNGKGRR
jgi:restriction system protein